MLSLYFFITQVVTPRYTALLDHWNYGEGKVFHMRASFHQDKQSDIYAFSVQGQTDIVIVTNGKIQAYQVALEADVMLISVSDVAEKNDLLVSDRKTRMSVPLYNNGGGFQATPPPKRG
jgi:hypothetical protein